MRFSPSKQGFFSENVVYPDLPDDLIDITDVEHMVALNTLNSGGTVTVVGGLLVITPLSQDVIDARQKDQAWTTYQSQAKTALNKSDQTVIRCSEKGVTVPTDWVTYRDELRSIISASTGDPAQPLPTQPAYPTGT